MTTEKEKLEVCLGCKNRKFDPMRGTLCSLSDAKPSFGDSCPNYAADEDAIARREALKPKAYTSEWLEQNTSISGWLAFFLGAIVFGALVSVGYAIATFDVAEYDGSYWLASVDIVIPISGLCAALYALYAFCKRKSNAVFWARVYVAAVFLSAIVAIVVDDYANDAFNNATRAVRSLIWAIIWFSYLALSSQVKEVIPVAFRRLTKVDWGALAVMILLPLSLGVVGMVEIVLPEFVAKQETEMKSRSLMYYQRTDGRVIFSVPSGYECTSEEHDIEGESITLFRLESEEMGDGIVCSDYDSDTSEENFVSCWESWKDESASQCVMEYIDGGVTYINAHKCRYQVVKYDINGIDVYWRFYLIFDDESGKCFLASFYDCGQAASSVDELLRSVEFD